MNTSNALARAVHIFGPRNVAHWSGVPLATLQALPPAAISPVSVQQGVPSRPRLTPKAVAALRASGLSLEAIANHFKANVATVEAVEAGKPWALTTPIKGERWAPLPGFFAEVSDHGRVRNCGGGRATKVIALRPSQNGRISVALPQNPRGFRVVSVHEAVFLAFGAERKGRGRVVHVNGQCDDNRLCNLAWEPAKHDEKASS